MQVTCPNCAARYAVDPLAIGPAGRTVQCARCHDRWFQTVERERPVPDLVIRPPSRAASSMGGNSLPAVIEARSPYTLNRILAASGLVLVVVLAVAIFVFRTDIMGLLPGGSGHMLQSDASGIAQAAKAATVAPDTPAPKRRQSLLRRRRRSRSSRSTSPTARSSSSTAATSCTARSSIRARRRGSTRSLRLVFKDDKDAVLGERAFALVRGPIAPGARLAFSQAFDDPPFAGIDSDDFVNMPCPAHRLAWPRPKQSHRADREFMPDRPAVTIRFSAAEIATRVDEMATELAGSCRPTRWSSRC